MNQKSRLSLRTLRTAAHWTIEQLEKRVFLSADSPSYIGTGLQAQYYNGASFATFVSSATDTSLDHTFTSAPGGITSSTYSVRWSGQIQPSVTGNYTFDITAGNGGTVWLNGQMIASEDGQTTPIKLITGRQYNIELDYEHAVGQSTTMKLQWAEQDVVDPGTLSFADIPTTSLYPAQRGSLTRQIFTTGFTQSQGYNITDLTGQPTYQADNPDQSQWIYTFQDPTDSPVKTHYGDRIEGYLYAPVSGNYTLAIASDDAGELDISSDANPANVQKIAYNTTEVSPLNWTAQSSQEGTVYLQAGQQYFIQALHTQYAGGDNLAVGWKMPGSSSINVIPGDDLSPVLSTLTLNALQSSGYAADSGNSLANQPITFQVQRTGADDRNSLAVGFNVYGTAPSSDYTIKDPAGDTLTNSITIPSGQATTTIIITPTLGATSTAWQTVDVQLLDGARYIVPTLSGGSAIGTIMFQSISDTDATAGITSMITTEPSTSNSTSLNPEVITAGTATITGPTAVSGEPFDWQYEVNVPGPVASATPVPPAPVCSVASGGSQPNPLTYYVRMTFVGSSGEGLASARSTVTVPGGDQLTVDSPAAALFPTGYTSYNVYLSTNNMLETPQNSSPIAEGTNWTAPANPPLKPTLSATSGGTLAAAKYYVVITYTSSTSETAGSAQNTLYMGADNLLNIASPASATGFTGYNVYVGTASGTCYRQNAAPIAIGTPWTEPTTGLTTAAIAPIGKLVPIVQSSGVPATAPPGGNVRLQAYTSTNIAANQVGWIDFWAKNNNTSISSTPEFSVRLAQTASPYNALYNQTFSVGTTWTHFSEPFTAAYAATAGNARLDFQLGGQAQDVLIGGVQMSLYPTSGSGVPTVNTLPLLFSNYQGRDITDAARTTAQANITTNRTSNLTFKVEDSSNGNALIDGAAVTLNETNPSFGFGSSINNAYLPTVAGTSNAYNDIIADYFNKVSNEGNMKWPGWEAGENAYVAPSYPTPPADVFINQMLSDGVTNIRGHNLVWPATSQLPVDQQGDTPAQLATAILTHIDDEAGNVTPTGGPTPYSTVNAPVKANVSEWDVVNEPDQNNNFFATSSLGEWAMATWYAEVARVAPATLRFLNENYQLSEGGAVNITSAGNVPSTEDQNFINWAQTFSQIQGLGLESHFDQNATGLTDVADTLAFMENAVPADKLEVTEYDMAMPTLDQQFQSDYLRDYMSQIYSDPNMTGFVVWDFMNDFEVNGSLWNSDGSIKPAGQQWVDQVWNQWNTFETGTTNTSGLYTADNAYQGSYDITVNFNGKTQTFTPGQYSGAGTTASPYILSFSSGTDRAPNIVKARGVATPHATVAPSSTASSPTVVSPAKVAAPSNTISPAMPHAFNVTTPITFPVGAGNSMLKQIVDGSGDE